MRRITPRLQLKERVLTCLIITFPILKQIAVVVDLICISNVVPGDKKEAAHQTQMFKKRIFDHESIRSRNFPETIGDKCCCECKASEQKCSKPAITIAQNQN